MEHTFSFTRITAEHSSIKVWDRYLIVYNTVGHSPNLTMHALTDKYKETVSDFLAAKRPTTCEECEFYFLIGFD